jgi:hypothetical protein
LDAVKPSPANIDNDDFSRSKDDDLRRWLTGEEDNLLTWLNENDKGETEAISSITQDWAKAAPKRAR